MLAFISNWFILLVYQPFLNLLVFVYWLLDKATGGDPDMGIAVIILTIIIRLLLLPMSIKGMQTEKHRLDVSLKAQRLEETHSDDPVEFATQKKALLRENKMLVITELINVTIQVIIAIMLWRMFSRGLTGQDLHLIYDFMPEVSQPFNLLFLDRFDLSHTSFTLNLFQSICLFILETLSVMSALPGSLNRSRAIKAQLVLPIVSFFVFLVMPAGKKLFVITTLIFSIMMTIIKMFWLKFERYKFEHETEPESPPEDKVLVDIKP